MTTSTAAPIVDADHQRALDLIARNPTVRAFDRTDSAVARSFADHKAHAADLATDLSGGEILTVIQPAKKGFWSTEWTVVGYGTERTVARRRAGVGPTVLAAVEQMHRHASHHNSHFFRPEEGLLGWYRRR